MQDNFKFNAITGYIARPYVKVCLQHALISIGILNILWDRIQLKKKKDKSFRVWKGIKEKSNLVCICIVVLRIWKLGFWFSTKPVVKFILTYLYQLQKSVFLFQIWILRYWFKKVILKRRFSCQLQRQKNVVMYSLYHSQYVYSSSIPRI